jgi:hypothetical protein
MRRRGRERASAHAWVGFMWKRSGEDACPGSASTEPGHVLMAALACGDIHRDLEAEAHIGEGGRRPMHDHLLECSIDDCEPFRNRGSKMQAPCLDRIDGARARLCFQFDFEDAQPERPRCTSSRQRCIEVEHRLQQVTAPSWNRRASCDRSCCARHRARGPRRKHCRDGGRAPPRSPTP